MVSMGGSAFGQPTPRLDLQQYKRVVDTLSAKLCPAFFGRVHAPRHLPSKQSFGDVDLLVSESRSPIVPERDLQASAAVRNGNITSFLYEGYQIDLIMISEANFGNALLNFDYGDVGMIIGMLVRNLGMKFGMKGLTLKVEHHKLKLSESRAEILDFLGLAETVWKEGFMSEDALFEWLKTCRYFRPSLFKKTPVDAEIEAPVVWNREIRRRKNARPMFSRWIEHVSTLPVNQERVDAMTVMHDALAFFGKNQQYDSIVEEVSLTRRIKPKFNGQLATAWTGSAVVGKELGKLMAMFKNSYGAKDLDSMDPEQIKDAFLQLHASQ